MIYFFDIETHLDIYRYTHSIFSVFVPFPLHFTKINVTYVMNEFIH